MKQKYQSAYNHYREQLLNRFETDITYEEYVEQYVKKRDKKTKKGKYLKYRTGDRVLVYYVGKSIQYPITIYKIDKYNKNREYRTL